MQSANLLYKKVQNKHGKQLNFMYHLTNREALTALFSCKARRKRLKQEKSVGRNARLRLVFLPTSWVF